MKALLAVVAASVLLLPACCKSDYHLFALHVVDSDGNPVVGATVTATNVGTSADETSITDSQGMAFVGEAVGSGQVRLVASLGSRMSPTATSTWRCDYCDHCTPETALPELVVP